MTCIARLASWSVALLVGVLLLSGCGGGVKTVKSASKEIDEAQRLLESARNWKRQAEYDAAMDSLNRAEDAVKAGRAIASGPESRRLTNLGLEIADEKSAVDTARITAPKKKEEKPVKVAISDDPEEAKKKAEDEKNKKLEAEAAKRKKEEDERIKAATKAAATKTKEEDDTGKTADSTTNTGSGGTKEPAKEKEPEKPKGIGPYPAISGDSPSMDIVKIECRDRFALAYFQLYNKGDKGKRIMDVKVFFKDKDNQTIIPSQACIVCPYMSLDLKKKDLTQQSDTLTMGSASIDGGGDARFVAVGEHDRARDVRKVGISIGYDDGTRDSQNGPSKPDAAPDGLKLR